MIPPRTTASLAVTCRIPVAFLAVACALLAAGCSDGTGTKDPEDIRRVVVLHLDTTRVDAIGCYGGLARTPNIDALCSRGRRYTHAIAPTPLTSPSIASFMTGRLSHRTGVYTVGGKLSEKWITLAEILRDNGFVTGGFTSNMVTANRSDGRSLGFDQGFGVYQAVLDESEIPATIDRRRFARDNASALTRAALDFVEKNADERFFLWMLFIDPHAPYAPPHPYEEMYETSPAITAASRRLTREKIGGQAYVEGELDSSFYVSRYYGEVSLVDRSIGALVERIEALPGTTLWVVTADHGESLGEHERWFEHGKSLSRSCVDVPLILACDGCVPPGSSDALVANVDLAPTILALLGIPAEPLQPDGRSLVPTFSASDPWPDRLLPINVETGDRWRGVRSAEFTLQTRLRRPHGVEDGDFFYRRATDPRETTNVAQRFPRELQRHKKFERAWFLAGGHEVEQDVRSEYEMTERLRALGYLD